MFLLEVTYLKPLQEVDRWLSQHRDFLQRHYDQGNLVVSGPQNPRTGGIILTRFKTRQAVEDFFHQDPFYLQQIASYRIIEFDPVKCDVQFKAVIPSP